MPILSGRRKFSAVGDDDRLLGIGGLESSSMDAVDWRLRHTNRCAQSSPESHDGNRYSDARSDRDYSTEDDMEWLCADRNTGEEGFQAAESAANMTNHRTRLNLYRETTYPDIAGHLNGPQHFSEDESECLDSPASVSASESGCNDHSFFNAGHRVLTALQLAAFFGWAPTVAYHAENSLDINAKDSQGATALMIAVEERQWDAVDELLAHGARIDLLTHQVHAALLRCAEHNRRSTIEELITHAAKPDIPIAAPKPDCHRSKR